MIKKSSDFVKKSIDDSTKMPVSKLSKKKTRIFF